MRVYRFCPIKGPAKSAWVHFLKKNGKAPLSIYKMPNNFKKHDTDKGDWGRWIAEYNGWKDVYDPSKPDVDPVRNIYSFISQQQKLELTKIT